MKSQRHIQLHTYIIGTLLLLSITASCVSTRVEANPYQDSAVNIECQKQNSWSYFWGLKQKRVNANPEVEGAVCPCREKAMSWVETKSSLGDFLLSLVTVGIVNHRTVTYGCARAQDGEGGLDD
ncbi:hypothetical protein [uncultured Dokdonia sp.]|uniref:hypothetical protein n=1 Tax=uncultured Dokdonia sp. TaxID=575653 RepID=UPI0026028C93|nr:hypothetical protein [uncultured Dokdonia sp.]